MWQSQVSNKVTLGKHRDALPPDQDRRAVFIPHAYRLSGIAVADGVVGAAEEDVAVWAEARRIDHIELPVHRADRGGGGEAGH